MQRQKLDPTFLVILMIIREGWFIKLTRTVWIWVGFIEVVICLVFVVFLFCGVLVVVWLLFGCCFCGCVLF